MNDTDGGAARPTFGGETGLLMPASQVDGAGGLSPAYTGRWIALRSPSRADYPTIFGWRNDLRSMFLWQPQRRVQSYEEFVEATDRLLRTTITFVVIGLREQRPVGLVQLYDINLQDGWAHFLAYIEEEKRRRPHGAEAVMALLDYAFSHFNFRKIYADVYGFNESVRDTLCSGGFVEEGRLRDHVCWNGSFWDLYQLAEYRDSWFEYRRRIGLQLVVQADFEELESQSKEPAHATFVSS